MRTKEEIQEATAKKIAEKNLQVGDNIHFFLWDEYGSEIDMEGQIVSIDGQHAIVNHQYGVCCVWLALANKV